MNIKAICFDLDGVYFTENGKSSFHQALSEEFGAASEIVDQFMYKSDAMSLLVRGLIDEDEFFNRMREQVGISNTNEEIIARWARDYEVNAQVRSVVVQVKELGYKTCVCTNNNEIRLGALESKFGFMNDFDVIVSSHEVGECKPSEKIFTELVTRLNINPEELLYSDDNPERLGGANNLGINTFVYENFEQFVKELNKFGVELK